MAGKGEALGRKWRYTRHSQAGAILKSHWPLLVCGKRLKGEMAALGPSVGIHFEAQDLAGGVECAVLMTRSPLGIMPFHL